MGLRKPPTIEEVFENPSIVAGLPIPMLQEIIEQLQALERGMGGSAAAEQFATPIDMAIATPKYGWMDTTHLRYLGDEIAEAVRASKEDGEQSALVVTMPPRHAKSHTCSVWTPFWHLAKHPDDNVLLVSAEHGNAARWGEKVRNLTTMYGGDYNLKLNSKKLARDDWELTTGGGMKCMGYGGQISGNPAKLLVFDDVIKNDEQARSEYQRETMWEWWDTTAVQRIEPDTTTIVIGTRYHEDDLIGRILKHSEDGDGIKVKLITLAAKAEADDPIHRKIGAGLWPDHFPQSFYDKKEAAVSPYAWNSIYQQRPSSPDGNMVDPTWWRFYKPSEMPGQFDLELQSWDISLDAQKKTDSFHAGLVISRKGPFLYLRDGFRKHESINTVISTMRQWNALYRGAVIKLVERATAGVTLEQAFQHHVGGGVRAWPPKGRQKPSKEAAMDAIIPHIRAGNVYLPLNPDGTQPRWVREFIEETRQFPRGTYDDYCDAFSQGAGYLLPSVRAEVLRAQDDAQYESTSVSSAEAHTAGLHRILGRIMESRKDALKKHGEAEAASIIPFSQGFRPRMGDQGRKSILQALAGGPRMMKRW